MFARGTAEQENLNLYKIFTFFLDKKCVLTLRSGGYTDTHITGSLIFIEKEKNNEID